ncbi:MAG: divalent cation tolerance protein CutA [Candidatus Bathyarchaeia archaeon]
MSFAWRPSQLTKHYSANKYESVACYRVFGSSVRGVIARDLVKRRLAACVNILPVASFFRWNDKLEEESFLNPHQTCPRHFGSQLDQNSRA